MRNIKQLKVNADGFRNFNSSSFNKMMMIAPLEGKVSYSQNIYTINGLAAIKALKNEITNSLIEIKSLGKQFFEDVEHDMELIKYW